MSAAKNMSDLRLSIIVPVYNERYLVGAVLERLERLELAHVRDIEILVVDDGSTDGTAELLEGLVAEIPRARLFRHAENRGKGAALRTAIEHASGDLIVFQDADLEYDPRDLAHLIGPFLEDGADVVYGSRFLSSRHRRVLYFRHTLGNRLITFLSNWFTDLNLTDVETCYKMFRGPLLKSIPLRSSDFRVEVEVTAKVARRQFRVFEVPISYVGRTYQEGKKIRWTDGVKALAAIVKYWLVDDIYAEDEYGAHILQSLERARRFNRWMARSVEPTVGDRVLEIGAGIGNITTWLVPRERYMASDIHPAYLDYLRNFALAKPYLEVAKVDVQEAGDFAGIRGQFDTVLCLNVLEHLSEPGAALANMYSALEPGGRLVLYVPQGPALFSTLDEILEHVRRYTRDLLKSEVEAVGFSVESCRHFNRLAVLGWWWNGKVLKRRRFGRWQLKLYDVMVPVLQRIDRLFPWKGLGLILVGRKPAEGEAALPDEAEAITAAGGTTP